MNKNPIKKLVDLSRYFGCDVDFIIGGSGNTSYKNEKVMYVKASGSSMATINEDGFLALDRKKLKEIMKKKYPLSPTLREEKIKQDLLNSRINPQTSNRPSVESNFHEMIDYPWVFHLHPCTVNALACSRQGKRYTEKILGNRALWIDYTDPGYTLARKIYEEKGKYIKKYKMSPQVIFLQNHGLIVGGNDPVEVKETIKGIIEKIKKHLPVNLPVHPANRRIKVNKSKDIFSLWIRRALGEGGRRIIYYLDAEGLDDTQLDKIQSITPDQIVYCRPEIILIEGGKNSDKVKEKISASISDYIKRKGYEPKIVIIKGVGIFGIGENLLSARNCAYTFWDTARVLKASKFFGGPHFLSKKETNFIDSWEVEAYRRKTEKTKSRLEGRVAIVTGAAQGVGLGIAENLAKEGAHVIIADINYKLAQKRAKELEAKYGESKALPCKVDVTKEKEVEKMVWFTLENFGGIDIFISNAGILTAGNIFELSFKEFKKVMDINCNAYFLCAKKVAEIMKKQGHGDIIQINSKSGKKGSKANFAYATSKFAGIGLTQSIAMDLAPYNIFVNAICPGNFLDLELWQEEGGLLDQYLSSGKVPGAKTRKDIENYYKELTLLERGCTIEDIMHTLFYILKQRGETGQAYNVTQGQEMR